MSIKDSETIRFTATTDRLVWRHDGRPERTMDRPKRMPLKEWVSNIQVLIEHELVCGWFDAVTGEER
jgi:hypothetical protein